MELIKGRPANEADRLDKEIRVYDLLDQLGMEYYRTDHEPATTMEVCNDIDKILGTLICKNLFLCNRQKTQFYLLMMPGDKVFKTKDLDKWTDIDKTSAINILQKRTRETTTQYYYMKEREVKKDAMR